MILIAAAAIPIFKPPPFTILFVTLFLLCFSLLATLVDLGKESLKDTLLETVALIDLGDAGTDLTNNLLLVVKVPLLQLQVIVKLFDNLLLLIILTAVVLFENLALLGSSNSEGLVDKPRALVVLDVGTDLANVLGETKVVKIVVLDLEVFAERDKDILGLLEVIRGGKVELVESESDGEVEGVIGGLVNDNEAVLVHGKVVKVNFVLGSSKKIA